MRRILITGSNRGIGLALVKAYVQQDDTLIFATCRNPDKADELNEIAAGQPDCVKVVQLDVASQESILESKRVISEQVDGLDMLINNAGVLPGGVDNRAPTSAVFGQLETEALLHVFHINAVSPVMVTQVYADLLRAGSDARVINMSSDAGSIHRRDTGCDYSYPASKAALNMLSRCLAGDFREDHVIVISLHPGWIQTSMGGVRAKLTLEEAVPTMVTTIDNLKMDDSSFFFNWDGKRLDW